MEKLHLLLAEAGLELVPRELWRHPAVRRAARRRGKSPGEILLDVSLHGRAMVGLPNREKRGRPDIAHFCALLAQGSILNRLGLLGLHIHTFDGRIIEVAPHVRLPRNYNRFVGLIEQLLARGRVPPNAAEPLLWIEPWSVDEHVERIKPSRVFLLSETGTRTFSSELAKRLASEERPMVIIGCFQAGDFSEPIRRLAHEEVAISQYALEAWTATAKILSAVEDALNLF